jgi:DNA-binding transcriptional LysR family regulator
MLWKERAGSRLKLRDLHIFLAVAQRGSMAKAAAELAISQPAVSKAIADMEYALGLRVLDRSRHGAEPTIYGRALAKRGAAIFDELKQGVDELEFLADPTAGELRVGNTEATTASVLPAIIDQLLQQYPRVNLKFFQAVFGTMQYRELRERSIDLLFGRIPTPFVEEDLEAQVLFDDPIGVIAGPGSRWARCRKLKLSDLANERWVLPPSESLPGSTNISLFHALGLDAPRAPVTTLSIHLACNLVATGRFVTILPLSILRFAAKDSLKVLPIKLPIQPRPTGIVTLKNRTVSPVARLFIDCAREVINPLAKNKWKKQITQ